MRENNKMRDFLENALENASLDNTIKNSCLEPRNAFFGNRMGNIAI